MNKIIHVFSISQLFEVGGGELVGFGGGSACGKNGYRGAPSQTNKGKSGGHEKYFSNTLKWHV